MAIYLDSSILWRWRTFAEADCVAVAIVARQLEQEICVPDLVAREAEEDYRRSLERPLAAVEKAQNDIRRAFGTEVDVILEPWPDVDAAVSRWRDRLTGFATVLPVNDADVRAAWDREIAGTPPAKPRESGKPGRGGRDAGIWLTVARHHNIAGEEGHFLCKDSDFFTGDTELHPRLRADLSTREDLSLYSKVGTFVEKLGTSVAGEITLDQLQSRGLPALVEGLRDSLEVPRAVWDELKPELRYRTAVTGAQPIAIRAQRRYEQGDAAVVVVDARWEMTVDCWYQQRGTETPARWSVVGEVEVIGDAQVLIEERDGELSDGQLIGAQLPSTRQLSFMSDGSVLSIG